MKQNLDIIFGTRGVEQVSNDMRKLNKDADSFFQRLKKQAGAGSKLDDIFQIVRGGGAIAGAGAGIFTLGSALSSAGNAAKGLSDGILTSRQAMTQFLEGLPLVGGMVKGVNDLAAGIDRTAAAARAAERQRAEAKTFFAREEQRRNDIILSNRTGAMSADEALFRTAKQPDRESTRILQAAEREVEQLDKVVDDLQRRIDESAGGVKMMIDDMGFTRAQVVASRGREELEIYDQLLARIEQLRARQAEIGWKAQAEAHQAELNRRGQELNANNRTNSRLWDRARALPGVAGDAILDNGRKAFEDGRRRFEASKQAEDEILSMRLRSLSAGSEQQKQEAARLAILRDIKVEAEQLAAIARNGDLDMTVRRQAQERLNQMPDEQRTRLARLAAPTTTPDRQFATFSDQRFGTGLAQSQREGQATKMVDAQAATTAAVEELVRKFNELLSVFNPVATFLTSLQKG